MKGLKFLALLVISFGLAFIFPSFTRADALPDLLISNAKFSTTADAYGSKDSPISGRSYNGYLIVSVGNGGQVAARGGDGIKISVVGKRDDGSLVSIVDGPGYKYLSSLDSNSSDDIFFPITNFNIIGDKITVLVFIDDIGNAGSGGAIIESNENNNSYSRTFNLGEPASNSLPDLKIKDIYFRPSNPVVGESYSGDLVVKVVNDRNYLAAGGDGIKISVVGKTENGSLFPLVDGYGYKYIISLDANSETEVVFPVTNKIYNDGAILAYAKVDDVGTNGNVAEYGEDNNTILKGFYFKMNAPDATKSKNIIISVNENNSFQLPFKSETTIYWDTNVKAKCSVDYTYFPDFEGTITGGNNLYPVGANTNEGKYFYTATLKYLRGDKEYSYKINCNADGANGTTGVKKLRLKIDKEPSTTIQVPPKNQAPASPTTNVNSNNVDQLLEEIKSLRNIVAEQANQIKYLNTLIKGTNISTNDQNTLNNFITYGSDLNTKKLGAGERAAVIYSYKSAFNKLPTSEGEIADVIKIANGRWPSATSLSAENQARIQFKKIYRREANMNNSNDNAAITIMAYGLKQKAENRNLSSEANGIKTFKVIYGRNPNNTEEWNVMQAITYSGAKR